MAYVQRESPLLRVRKTTKGKGSSSGKYGMEISKAHCGCSSMKGPITQRAK